MTPRASRLPWELLHDGARFLVREGKIDLVRTTLNEVAGATLLREPSGPFRVVVNVSAPPGHPLKYEEESYRLTLALTDQCPMTPTELGTLSDLVETVQREQPTGVHFSGHGGPGMLAFEDDFGDLDRVPVVKLVERLRGELTDGRLPPFFYLACCHGNDVGEGAESAAAILHREGVTQVVGYSGPILDDLSTDAEAALYAALAAGRTTQQAVAEARQALVRQRTDIEGHARDGGSGGAGLFPFAWSQLVLYHRGPDFAGWARRCRPARQRPVAEHCRAYERSFRTTRGRSVSSRPASSVGGARCTRPASGTCSASRSACSYCKGWAAWANRRCR